MGERLSGDEPNRQAVLFDHLTAAINTGWSVASEAKLKEIDEVQEKIYKKVWRDQDKLYFKTREKYLAGELKFDDHDPRKPVWEFCRELQKFGQENERFLSDGQPSFLDQAMPQELANLLATARSLNHGKGLDHKTKTALMWLTHELANHSFIDMLYLENLEKSILLISELDLMWLPKDFFDQFKSIIWDNFSHRVGKSPLKECAVVADSSGLYIVIKNLIDNSVKHGGKNLADLAVFEWVGISEDEKVRIIYADNGAGFDPKMLEEIDGKACALKRGVTTGGTGLGLWLVDDYIEGIGGQVNLLNAKDLGIEELGATTVIDFPMLHEPITANDK